MNLKEIKELIEFLKQEEIAEFEMERGDFKVRIRRAGDSPVAAPSETRFFAMHSAPPPMAVAQAPVVAAPPAAPAEAPAAEAGLHEVRSPIVGTFYESPSPGAPPFIKVGDVVQAGQVLCIIEAMKLMNEIEADASGEIVKKLASNGQPIEYGQALFLIRPKS